MNSHILSLLLSTVQCSIRVRRTSGRRSRAYYVEGQVVDARADEMGLRVRGGAAVADAQDAVAVEFGGVLAHNVIPHVVSGDADDAACGELDAIGKRQVL